MAGPKKVPFFLGGGGVRGGGDGEGGKLNICGRRPPKSSIIIKQNWWG